MKKIISIIGVFLFLSAGVFAQTIIKDTILYSKMTLSKNGSPYTINGNITIKAKGTLEVQAGVKLLITSKAHYILNDGTISIKGVKNDSIIIMPNTNTKSGFYFTSTGSNPNTTSEFNYCVISNFSKLGISAINSRVYNCDYGLERGAKNCYIHNCKVGVNSGGYVTNTKIRNCNIAILNKSDFTYDSLDVQNNNVGIKEWGSSFGNSMFRSIKNSLFKNNVTGVEYYCTDGERYFKFNNNRIIDNDSGIVCVKKLYYITTETPFKNNKVCNNTFNVVYRELYENSRLNDMCFCTNDTIEIRKRIYDGRNYLEYAYLTLGNIELDCRLDDNVSVADYLTLSGTVHQTTSFLKNGKVIVYNIDNNSFKQTNTDSDGNFVFDSLSEGNYIIKAIPNVGDNYLTTYFPNKSDSLNAFKINLDGDISSVDIFMNTITGIDIVESSNFNIKPNPFDNQIVVSVGENIKSEIKVTLLNSTGDNILNLIISEQDREFAIDSSNIPSGFYFLKLESKDMTIVEKVLKR